MTKTFMGRRVRLVAAMTALLLTGCDTTEVAQLISAVQQATPVSSATPSPTPVPSSSPTPNILSANGSTCTYTISLTYNLGPGIDVTQSFEALGTYRYGIGVTEVVLQSIATGCPENTWLPAAGDSKRGSASEIVSENGSLTLYPTRYSQPIVFTVSSPTGSLVTPDSMTLTMSIDQVTHGRETQIFDSGSLQSAQAGSDALMTLHVTYVYAEK